MMMKTYRVLFMILLVFVSIQAVHVNTDKLYEIARNIEIFTNVYKELNTYYVDELDPSELMKTGIDAMVSSLDPYTRYISESQIESFRISTQGKYSGIGAVVREVDSVVTVVKAYKDSPAIKAGMIAGDQILTINGKSTRQKKSEDVLNIMRGAPGTEVELSVHRYGETEPRKIVIEREEINIPNVPYQAVLEGGIGYIHLSKFTEHAGNNVRNALRKMKSEHDLNGLILDLRSNGGGLLREAIAVTNVFIKKDEDIVSTRGKVIERDRFFKTMSDALDTSIAVAVLINNRSASASEIVCGSIQDLDRGVLIGQKSYGKGLVQNTKKVGYNSQVKLTTSKYYIPSGRCIQSVAYKDGKPVDIPDEQRKEFKTRNGRRVLDGGGVMPDIVMKKEPTSDFVQFLLKNNVIFKYVNDFYSRHDSIEDVPLFKFDEYVEFIQFYDRLNMEYESELEKKFEIFNEKFKGIKNRDTTVENLVDSLYKKLIPQSDELLLALKDEIVMHIEKEIIGRYYYINGIIRYELQKDAELEKAISILTDRQQYNSILSGQK